MSTNYYFILKPDDRDPPSLYASNGEYVQWVKPEQYSHDLHIGKRACQVSTVGEMTFTWAVPPYNVYKKLVQCCFERYGDPHYLYAIDEYGREFTAEEFRILLDDCPVWRLHAIGTKFS